jgi:anaphase-promoting complex subunit 5
MHSRDRSYYQYALLNLAILQADFGCHREAVSAMQEAIAIARESHDMNCLNFCMSWLYHFGKAFPEEMKDIQNTGMLGSEKEGLAFLKSKAKETEMWSLLSTTLLSEAKIELQNVRKHNKEKRPFMLRLLVSLVLTRFLGRESFFCV